MKIIEGSDGSDGSERIRTNADNGECGKKVTNVSEGGMHTWCDTVNGVHTVRDVRRASDACTQRMHGSTHATQHTELPIVVT